MQKGSSLISVDNLISVIIMGSIMATDQRSVKIDKQMLRRAATDDDYRCALVLSLVIKREFVNSVMYDFSIRKIMQMCGCNYSKAVKSIDSGIKYGLLRIKTDTHCGKERKHLTAKHLYNEYGVVVKLSIASANNGKWLYIENDQFTNEAKYMAKLKKGERQTFKDVEDKIKMANMLLNIWRHERMRNHYIHQILNANKLEEQKDERIHANKYGYGMAGKQWRVIYNHVERLRQNGETCPLNRGYSINEMRAIFNDGYGRFFIRRILKKLTNDKLIKTGKCFTFSHTFKEDEEIDLNCFDTFNPEKGVMENEYDRVYLFKGDGRDDKVRYIRRMANNYFYHSSAVRFVNKWKMVKIFIYRKQKEILEGFDLSKEEIKERLQYIFRLPSKKAKKEDGDFEVSTESLLACLTM